MTIFQAIVLGAIQGLGEFLPISSSAHLALAPWLFGWQKHTLSFDVALHLGTLIAVVLFFWRDWISLIKSGFTEPKTMHGKLFWFLVIASVPGALIGKLFEEQAESTFRNPALIGFMLIIMGVVLYLADKNGRKKISAEKIGLKRSLIIGLSQALAIVPGVSRSGITISAGLFSGLTREGAARFSFLLSTPIIAGAALLKVKEIIHPETGTLPLLAGIITSAVVGLISIKFLLEYIKNKGFGIFVAYRFILGALVIILSFVTTL